jgi:ATP-dependent DNA helicase RecG
LPIKISVESYTRAYRNKGYSHPTIQNLKAIYDDIEVNQVFSSTYLVKILECSERTARGLIGKLKEMDVVVAVMGKGRGKGQGKGIYRFKYEDEV